MRFVPKSRKEILQRMVARVVARTNLTDLTEGALGMQLVAATSREVEDIGNQLMNLLTLFDLLQAEGDDLDEIAKVASPNKISPRRGATRATVPLTLGGTPGTVLPAGVQVAAGSYVFSTISELTIGGGGTINGSGQAANPGSDYNVGSGTVTRIVSTIAGLNTVTNAAAASGGEDRETDDDFRQRIVDYMRSLVTTTPYALEGLAKTIGVTSHNDDETGDLVFVYDEETEVVRRVVQAFAWKDPVNPGNVTLYIDDGVGFVGVSPAQLVAASGAAETLKTGAAAGDRKLLLTNWPIELGTVVTIERQVGGAGAWVPLVEGADFRLNRSNGEVYLTFAATAGDNYRAQPYTYSLDLVRAVQLAVEGDSADRERLPGWRAAGDVVYVRRPTVALIDVTATISVQPGFTPSDVEAACTSAVTAYLNGLSIGADVILAQLIEEIMRIDGVYDVGISIPATTIAVPDEQVAKADTVTISAA